MFLSFFTFLIALKVIIFLIREEPQQRNAIVVKPRGTQVSLTRKEAHNAERPPGMSHRQGTGEGTRTEPDAEALLRGRQLPFELMLLQISCWEETRESQWM